MGQGDLFGTDGIRGQANHYPMTAEVALRVGMAAGHYFRKISQRNGRHRVVIGKDTRLSGYMVEPALTAGFVSVGTDVFLLGPMPTPGVAMLTRSLRADMGVMISASHNSFEDNGIKIFGPDGFKLSDESEKEIESLVMKGCTELAVSPPELGRVTRLDEGEHGRYIEFAKRTLPRGLNLSGLRVAIDCAHGASYRVAPQVLWELGADVVRIGTSPDGFNINREVGSTCPHTLRQKLYEVRADIGIALDGDGDRVVLIDEKGQIIDGDQILAVIAQSWRREEKLSANGVVGTVMSNLGLERFLKEQGLTLARTQVGDRYVVEHMRSHGFNLGGEPSGHVVLLEHTTTGDGLVAALQILAEMKLKNKPASEIGRCFVPVPQFLRSAPLKNPQTLSEPPLKDAIENGEGRLGTGGRLIVRPSGTEPVLRVMAEGEDSALAKQVVDDIIEAALFLYKQHQLLSEETSFT